MLTVRDEETALLLMKTSETIDDRSKLFHLSTVTHESSDYQPLNSLHMEALSKPHVRDPQPTTPQFLRSQRLLNVKLKTYTNIGLFIIYSVHRGT